MYTPCRFGRAIRLTIIAMSSHRRIRSYDDLSIPYQGEPDADIFSRAGDDPIGLATRPEDDIAMGTSPVFLPTRLYRGSPDRPVRFQAPPIRTEARPTRSSPPTRGTRNPPPNPTRRRLDSDRVSDTNMLGLRHRQLEIERAAIIEELRARADLDIMRRMTRSASFARRVIAYEDVIQNMLSMAIRYNDTVADEEPSTDRRQIDFDRCVASFENHLITLRVLIDQMRQCIRGFTV